ncbi:MAG: HU family DNA-binding protein [Prevotella sp.]|nr:HU family DNA-binding protein [Prevotella sp.]
MGKINIADLADFLGSKHGITKKEAQTFINAVISVIKDGIDADRMVKVKGLGTFKVVDVEPRESVSVRTGERLTIEGHSKVTFLPDKAMKEMVNKPFSMFDTITLNGDVDLGDTSALEGLDAEDDDSVETEESEPEAEVTVPEPAVEEKTPSQATAEEEAPSQATVEVETLSQTTVEEAPTQTAVEEEAPSQADPILEIVDEPLMVTETPPVEQPAAYEDEEDEDDEEEYNEQKSSSRWWIWLSALILLAAIGVAVWWFFLRKPAAETVQPQQPVQTESVDTPVATDTAQVADAPTDSLATATADTQVADSVDYEQMDNRVRTGAYRITGLDHIVPARQGDTPKKIARREFGGEEMSCYIEVYNGISSGTTIIEAGTEIKIPKIELKNRNN